VLDKRLWWKASLALLLPALACGGLQQAPRPVPTIQQLAFEVQTVTPTIALLFDPALDTPTPPATPTPTITATLTETATVAAAVPEATAMPAGPEPAPPPTDTPEPAPTVPPLQGGAWDFEDGFQEWRNPHGDVCPGSGLANGWTAFTTRDEYGSSCMNQTTWHGNVYSGESAQEITFAYVGNQAGIFRTAPTIPGHQYTVTAYMRREFSPARVETALGLDPTGGVDWQAESVVWFPWREDIDDAWAKTEETMTATGETMTIFIKGSHPYPEPGGTLRLDAISIADLGPAS
jgi:hypothetical protein